MSYFPEVTTLTIDGRKLTDIPNLITLKGFCTVTNHFSSFALQDGTFYSVPALKTFVIAAISIVAATSNNQALLGYGSTGVGFDSAAGPVGQIYEFGSSTAAIRTAGATAYVPFEATSDFEVPTTMFPFFNSSGNGFTAVTIYGYEV